MISIPLIAIVAFILPAITVCLLKVSSVNSFLVSIAVYLSLFLLISTYWCRDSDEEIFSCVGSIFVSVVGVSYLIFVLLGAAFGCIVKSVLKA